MRKSLASNPSLMAVFIHTPVLAADGKDLGQLVEVRGDQFKVEGTLGNEFWLDKRTVRWADDRTTALAYDSAQIEDFKVDRPGVSARSPVTAAQMETFSSEDEQETRRRQMERGHA